MKEALGTAPHAIERCLETLIALGHEVPEGEVLVAGRAELKVMQNENPFLGPFRLAKRKLTNTYGAEDLSSVS